MAFHGRDVGGQIPKFAGILGRIKVGPFAPDKPPGMAAQTLQGRGHGPEQSPGGQGDQDQDSGLDAEIEQARDPGDGVSPGLVGGAQGLGDGLQGPGGGHEAGRGRTGVLQAAGVVAKGGQVVA